MEVKYFFIRMTPTSIKQEIIRAITSEVLRGISLSVALNEIKDINRRPAINSIAMAIKIHASFRPVTRISRSAYTAAASCSPMDSINTITGIIA
jgi:hypothetical protein